MRTRSAAAESASALRMSSGGGSLSFEMAESWLSSLGLKNRAACSWKRGGDIG